MPKAPGAWFAISPDSVLRTLRLARRRSQNFAGGAFRAFLHGVGAQRPDQHEGHSGAAPFNRREALINARRDARRLFRLRALEIKPHAGAVLRFIEKKAGQAFQPRRDAPAQQPQSDAGEIGRAGEADAPPLGRREFSEMIRVELDRPRVQRIGAIGDVRAIHIALR